MSIKENLIKVGAVGLVITGGYYGFSRVGGEANSPKPVTRAADGFVPTPTPIATSTPEATEVAKGAEIVDKLFSIQGIPDRVDATKVLAARGADAYGNTFTNTIGLGTEMIFADPGVLKVGPELSQVEVNSLGKSAERYNPSNQAVIATSEGFWSVREGGFTILNGNNMEIEVAGNDKAKPFKVALGGDEVNHWIVVIRGLFPDQTTPKDRNSTVKITNHPAGHTLVDSYPLGAYISEGHLKQMVKNAHNNYPNSGDAGSIYVRIFILDLNTGAYLAVVQKGLNGPWETLGRNW